jgi:hypothetical protein
MIEIADLKTVTDEELSDPVLADFYLYEVSQKLYGSDVFAALSRLSTIYGVNVPIDCFATIKTESGAVSIVLHSQGKGTVIFHSLDDRYPCFWNYDPVKRWVTLKFQNVQILPNEMILDFEKTFSARLFQLRMQILG